MSQFRIGDWVYASDWCFGQIVRINKDNTVDVEFDTCGGGGTACFLLKELTLASEGETNAFCIPYKSNV